jgi:hypothetical protein
MFRPEFSCEQHAVVNAAMTCLNVCASTSLFLYRTLLPELQSNLTARDSVILMQAVNNKYTAVEERRGEERRGQARKQSSVGTEMRHRGNTGQIISALSSP